MKALVRGDEGGFQEGGKGEVHAIVHAASGFSRDFKCRIDEWTEWVNREGDLANRIMDIFCMHPTAAKTSKPEYKWANKFKIK